MLKLLSAKTTAQLEDPLRVKRYSVKCRKMLMNVLKKGKAVEVFITGFEVR